MANYINLEAAIDAVTNVYYNTPDINLSADKLEVSLRRIPVADVVPVVRCKNCAHSREKDDYESAYLCYGTLICTNSEVGEDGWLPVWPQHFCSYGTKKQEME